MLLVSRCPDVVQVAIGCILGEVGSLVVQLSILNGHNLLLGLLSGSGSGLGRCLRGGGGGLGGGGSLGSCQSRSATIVNKERFAGAAIHTSSGSLLLCLDRGSDSRLGYTRCQD